MYGIALKNVLQDMKKHGYKVKEKTTDKGFIYELEGATSTLTVTIESKWLGLELSLGSGVDYRIDTDLYDINKDQYKEFAKGIEQDIVDFLVHLQKEEILIAQNGKKNLLLIPTADGIVLLKQGRFFSSQSVTKVPEKIQSKHVFRPLKI